MAKKITIGSTVSFIFQGQVKHGEVIGINRMTADCIEILTPSDIAANAKGADTAHCVGRKAVQLGPV